SVRGLSATWNEVGIALMANNLIKLAKVSVNLKGYGQKQEGNSRFVRISFLFFIEFELCPELFFILPNYLTSTKNPGLTKTCLPRPISKSPANLVQYF
ncbi:hypothetical protein DIS15_11375, partial [Levilactobacillus brevis]